MTVVTAARPVAGCLAVSRGDALYDQGEVRRLFDRMAASYDRMNLVMSLGFSALWRRQALALVDRAPTPVRVLDLMSGRGETWSEIVRRFPGARITAVDFSEGMSAQADARNRTAHDGDVTVLCQDALRTSIADGSIDVVVSAYGLKTFNAAQSERLADEVARVLRPGGSFVFVDVTEPPCCLLRAAYRLYLRCVVPVAGILLLSDPTEYRMLHRYLAAYGDGRRSVDAFTAHGALRVTTRRHFFGCATSVYGRRAD